MKSGISFPILLILAAFVIFISCEEGRTPATLSTKPVTEITPNSAKSGGNITDDGGAPVTDRGVVWSTSEEPTTVDNDGMTNEGEGTGEFTSELSDLNLGETYYVRAYAINKIVRPYAINSAGTAYGEQREFTTSIEPEADFSADETEVIEGTAVNSTDESTGDPTEWEWVFGDGNTSTEQNPYHTKFGI